MQSINNFCSYPFSVGLPREKTVVERVTDLSSPAGNLYQVNGNVFYKMMTVEPRNASQVVLPSNGNNQIYIFWEI